MTDLCDQRHPDHDVPCVFTAHHTGPHQAVALIRQRTDLPWLKTAHAPVMWTTPKENHE